MYSARIFLQHRQVRNGDGTPRPQEWISNMKDGVKMCIEHFVQRNRIMPRRIIMYRDGVGETMFLQVIIFLSLITFFDTWTTSPVGQLWFRF